MKEQIIQIPDNFEIKEIKDNKIILVEKEKKLTYEDVAKKLFSKPSFYMDSCGNIESSESLANYANDSNNCTSKKQAQKLLAINKLMNVAKYLNGDWQPDWSNHDKLKWFIDAHVNHYIDSDDVDTVSIYGSISHKLMSICFKSRELALQAIEILGEETIKLALCTDY